MLEGIDLFQDQYVLFEREDGQPQLRATDFKSGASHRIEFPEQVYSVFPGGNAEFKTSLYRFNYQSPITPSSVYDYDVATRQRKLMKQQEVLGGYDSARYQTERVFATAPDGTKVPISLVYKKGFARDGKAPLFLSGYGSYGFATADTFDSNDVSLLDHGVVLATAHIRGGGEMGKKWHDQGRMMSKINTFTDFISCAEYLLGQGYGSKDRLAIQGGSAGGLLMGAVTNMRPDLFKVVVAHVPFVDVINTMLDESLPLTVGEFEEWGNPKIKEQYEYMMAYSPYDNVTKKDYPTLLVKTSLNDSQVMYWEPAKYVAKLRAMKTDSNLLVFKINMDPAGHGGQSGRYNRLREIAFDYALVLWQLGVVKV
jgi:oligopeptidase B